MICINLLQILSFFLSNFPSYKEFCRQHSLSDCIYGVLFTEPYLCFYFFFLFQFLNPLFSLSLYPEVPKKSASLFCSGNLMIFSAYLDSPLICQNYPQLCRNLSKNSNFMFKKYQLDPVTFIYQNPTDYLIVDQAKTLPSDTTSHLFSNSEYCRIPF